MKDYVCVFCKKKGTGYDNNPATLKKKGQCCDDCNLNKVLPERIKIMSGKFDKFKEETNLKYKINKRAGMPFSMPIMAVIAIILLLIVSFSVLIYFTLSTIK